MGAGPTAGLAEARTPSNGGYIVGPLYDKFFFIYSPLIAMALGIGLSFTVLGQAEVSFQGQKNSLMVWFLGPFIMAHLVAVVFRSHLNGSVFRRYPLRFTLVPLALFLAMGLSSTALVFVSVAATFWDVYHSGMQTFGLGRIYDARAGNDPHKGRRFDAAFNLLIYAGPIAAGATLMDHVGDFDEFAAIGAVFFTRIPVQAEGAAGALMWAVIAFGVPFVALYLWWYWRMAKAGWRMSRQKAALYASTALCSIWAWGFNPFGEAFFIMNVFHALQYFAIVWWRERGTMIRAFRLSEAKRAAKPAALVIFLISVFAFGFVADSLLIRNQWFVAGVMCVAIMHFWYDGFVWSVRRQEV
ncbi:MAG: hypothetical protein HOM52_02495 [Rhodospirillaceae bacterium]|nr:hypothetical protein [Rhodospirillaceae bacterium]